MELNKEIEAGYNYVESVLHTADDKRMIMWHGWALRDAFVAGTKWREKQLSNKINRRYGTTVN